MRTQLRFEFGVVVLFEYVDVRDGKEVGEKLSRLVRVVGVVARDGAELVELLDDVEELVIWLVRVVVGVHVRVDVVRRVYRAVRVLRELRWFSVV